MANLLSNTTIGGYQSIHTGNIGSYAITSIPTSFSSITVTSSFDTASNDVYASVRVIRNNSSTYQDGMYIGYGNSGSGITRIFGGGSTTGALVKATDYTYEPGSFRAPIFYDSADTSYYLDPNSTSYLYHLILSGNSYFRPNTWIQFDGNYGLYWPNNYALHLYPNNSGSYGALQINGTKGGWAGIHFDNSANTLMANSNESGFHRQGNGWQFRWTEGTMYVHRSASGGGTAYTVLDTGNYNSFSIPTKQYIWSRGENLLTNGTALLGNNTNFSSFTFDGSQAYSSSGSFRYTGQYHSPNTDELMPINAEKRYRLDFWAKTANGQGAYYAYLNFFDVDGNAIMAPYHMYYPNTLTTLAQTLNPGDTVAYLTSVANWENGGTAGVNTHIRSFIFWNYTNSFGYTYPPQTYSRNWYSDAWNPGAINSGNNTITLRVPWSGPSIPAGTQVSNGSAGGTFKYIALGYTIVPTTWTNYVGIMDGIDYSGSNAGGKFPPGTAAAKLGFLTDYNGSGDTIYLANLFVGVDNDYPIYDRWTGNTRIEKAGAFYGTIFYDSNNDGYYLDPNSTSNLYRVDAAAQMRAPIFYDSQDTNYYLDPNSTSRLGTLNINQLSVYGNTYLGDGNGDEVHINDILRVGATDSGDAHIFFGEGGSAGSDYGAHLYWDSGYRFTWYTRNAGTDSTLFYYDTNSLSYITWGRSLSMNTNSIDYTGQLHFSGGTRFQSMDTHYLKFRTDATDYGSIQVRDANESVKGYLGYFDANGFGLLNSAGNWGIRLNPGNGDTVLYSGGTWKLTTTSAGISVNGNVYTDQNYGHGLVGLYSASRYQGVFAMGDAYKLSADGTSTGTLYGIAWTHTNVGGQSKSGLGHQALFMDNGNTQTAIGSGIWTNGLITTTSYGTSANWKSAYDWGNHASAGYLRLNTWEGNSYIATGGAHYGTIFYDSNDTNYYVDPNSSSRVSRLWVDKLGGIGTYSWVDAALTTSSIEIVNQVGENGSLPPTLAFHWYGDGGPQFRLAADTSNILYLESAAAGSANTATNSTTYFNSLRLICQDATGLYVNGNGVWHRGDFSSANISNWNTAYSWGNHASAGYLTSLPSHNHDDRYYTESEIDSQISNRLYQARVNGLNVNAFNATGLYRGSTGDWSNRPTITHNGGALLTIDTHPGDYHSQLFFDTGGDRLYFRNANGGSWGSWVTMWHSGNLTNLNQLSNGPGYITSSALSSYVPLSGATLTEGNYFYFRSDMGAYLGATNSPSLQAFATGGNAAFMSFHRGGNYAVNFGLDSDNVMRIGGWSAAADRWVLDMSGNNTVAGSFRAPIFYDSANTNFYGDFASTSVMNSIRFGTSTNNATLSGASTWGVTLTTDAGWIQFGPANGSWAHIYASQSFYFNQDLYVNGNIVITSATIGSQSVSYASSAGSVAWTNVSSRPTALSQFTNDLGNYGGFLTSITAHTHSISDVSGLQTALDGKQAAGSYAASSHTHDDRYYTESESDTRFARRDADSAISGNLVIGNGTYGSSTAYGNSGARLMFSGSDGDAQGNYYIGTNHNDYGGNYSKLELRWHTGIRMGAQPGYGGIRFYDTEDLGTVIFSVGTGDSHVRVTNNLYVGGNLALHAGNYNSYSPTLTGGNASGTWGINVTGSAGSVAWTNVSSRPTNLSQFTNDLGNYGGFLTSITAHTHAISDVSGLQTALDGKQASGSYLTTSGKAADSELLDGIDSAYFVRGTGVNTLGYRTTNQNNGNSAGGLSSGFYDGSGMSNMPTSDWYHLIVNAHYNSATNNQYEFQLATAFWDKSNFYVRSISPGDVGPWRTLIHNGNIGSQSVNYANSAGSATSATTATTATVASQLNKFGDIYGQDWNAYYIQDKFIAAAVYGHSGANRPVTTYDYGVALSYGEASGPVMQMYFPENSPNLGTIFRKAHYRTGWNGNWSTWKTIVEQEGNTCTIVGGNQTGMEIHANVGYNQDPLTYFLLRGQADTSWKALKIRLTGDAGGQDIEFRRIAENGTDARMFYVPRGANQVIFDYQFVQGSDSRLKDNIIPITNSLDKVKSLRGVEFDWNSGVNEGTHDVGLIAQEVEAVLPEAVTTQEDGYKNLAYTKVIPLLVEAMKEQQVMIDALKAEIELLKNR